MLTIVSQCHRPVPCVTRITQHQPSDLKLPTSDISPQTLFTSHLVHILLTLKFDQHFCITIIHLLKLSLEFCKLVHHSDLTFRSTHIDGCEFIDTLMKSLFRSTSFFVLFVKFSQSAYLVSHAVSYSLPGKPTAS